MNLYLRMLLVTLFVRFRPKVDLWAGSHTSFRVWPNDLDIYRHVTNSRYLGLCDLSRLDLMSRSGYWGELNRRGWYPVVTAQTISYRRSLKLWQRFAVRSKLLGFDDKHSYIEQTFLVRGEAVARAVVQARFLRRSGGSVPQAELEESVGGYPEDLELPAWVREWARSVRICAVPGA